MGVHLILGQATVHTVGLFGVSSRNGKNRTKPKLDEKDVKEIRALWRDESIPVADIARRYGVSRTTLYKHLEQAPKGATC